MIDCEKLTAEFAEQMHNIVGKFDNNCQKYTLIWLDRRNEHLSIALTDPQKAIKEMEGSRHQLEYIIRSLRTILQDSILCINEIVNKVFETLVKTDKEPKIASRLKYYETIMSEEASCLSQLSKAYEDFVTNVITNTDKSLSLIQSKIDV